MSLLFTPNGFPLFCSKLEFENVAREVNNVLDGERSSINMSFEKQLEVLSVFTWALTSVGNIFKPFVKYPNVAVSPTVAAYLTSLASDLERKTKPARDMIIWSSLFALHDNEANHKAVSTETAKVLRDASVYAPYLVVSQLSKVMSITEVLGTMDILFGDHTGN